MWIKVDRETMEMLRTVKKESETPIDIEFKEFTPRNHMIIQNQNKARCNALKEFNSHWWTRVISGKRGNHNYQIEMSHVDGKKFIKCNYDNFMSIPLDEIGPNEPALVEKGTNK